MAIRRGFAVAAAGLAVAGMLTPAPGTRLVDRAPPTVRISTANRTIFHPASTSRAVRGTASDKLAGVRSVVVYYRSCVEYGAVECSGYVTHQSTWWDTLPNPPKPAKILSLKCGSGRRSCSWVAALPATPGGYFVWAWARDYAGNIGRAPWRYVTMTA